MQKRHTDPELYFKESAESSRKHYLPYLKKFKKLNDIKAVLEIGCSYGGNLMPFYEKGARVIGIDLEERRIDIARSIFSKGKKIHNSFDFRTENFLYSSITEKFDLIIVHDVIEHIKEKEAFMIKAKKLLSQNGIIFFAFPAWHMPFGGHQQICENKLCSKLPFIHLLPFSLYERILKLFGEKEGTIAELMDIKNCRVSIQHFDILIEKTQFKIIDCTLWFINPHYEVKFGIAPRRLAKPIAKIKHVRDFFSTSCFYVLN